MAQPQSRPIRFAAIGLDHRHIYEMTGRLLELGCACVGYWTEGEPQPLAGFIKRYPHIPRVNDQRRLLEDATVQLTLTAAIPCDRAAIAIAAMRAGKDVMTDKPGCTSAAQLGELRRVVAATGRFWSVSYGRFETPAVTRALELIAAGAIGRVVQTVALGPHRLNRHLRPACSSATNTAESSPTSAATRSISFSLSPARTTPRSSAPRSATLPIPATPASRISARCCCATTTAAAMRVSTGTRPTD
jgi:hypothetical protein